MNNRRRKVLYGLLESLRQLEAAPDDCNRVFDLQYGIRTKIISVERQQRRLATRFADLRRALRTGRNPKAVSLRIKRQTKACENRQADNDAMLRNLRAIGDGIAYSYFNRFDLKPLAFKEDSGFISGKVGSALELQILRRLCKEGAQAILCDVTNVLRYGDIVIAYDGEPPRFLEVKTSELTSPRRQRQAASAESMAAYLHDDKPHEIRGFKVRRHAVSSMPTYHVAQLNDVIAAAYGADSGTALVAPEKGLAYFAIAPHGGEGDDTVRPLVNHVIAEMPKAHLAYLNAGKEHWDTYYPYVLAIRDSTHVVDFMAGDLELVVACDADHLVRQLDELGCSLTVLKDEDYFGLVVPKNPRPTDVQYMNVGHHYWGRIFTECMSLESFAREVAERVSTVHKVFENDPPEARPPLHGDAKP